MRSNHWCVILGTVGWLILGAADHQGQSAKPAPSAKQMQGVIKPPLPYRPYPNRYADACYDAKDHDTADLCAQWRAALAAEKAADEARLATIAAIVGTILSLATVVGLIITIYQTNGALAEARRGNRLNLLFERRARREGREAAADTASALSTARRNADATAELVKVSEETAKKQLRAYLDFDGVEFIAGEAGRRDPDHTWSGISIRIKNFGRTPARSVKAVVEYVVFTSQGEAIKIAHDDKDFAHISPTDHVTSYGRFDIPNYIWDSLQDGIGAIHVHINIEYRDIFDDLRQLACVFENYKREMFGYVGGTRVAT